MLEVRCNVTETGLEVREPRGEKKNTKIQFREGEKKKKKNWFSTPIWISFFVLHTSK